MNIIYLFVFVYVRNLCIIIVKLIRKTYFVLSCVHNIYKNVLSISIYLHIRIYSLKIYNLNI